MSSNNDNKRKLENLIKNLSDFLDIPSARRLTKALKSKIAKIETKETKAAESIEAKDARVIKANILRSSKMKRHHHFTDLIREAAKADGIDVSYLEARRQIRDRKLGKDVSIPSVIWENPSP